MNLLGRQAGRKTWFLPLGVAALFDELMVETGYLYHHIFSSGS
jgi:hypothetical protein